MRNGQLDHHILKQKGGEGSLACVFLVTHRREMLCIPGGSTINSMLASSIMCWDRMQCMRVRAAWAVAFVGMLVSSFYVLWSLMCVWILVR